MELTPRTFAALREVNTAGGLGDMFRFGPGVFSAVHRAKRVYFADGLALGVEFKPGADIREFAAGAATEALAPAGFRDGQKGGYSPLEFGGPGVFGGLFYFINSHNQGISIAFRRANAINSRADTSNYVKNGQLWRSVI
jgi:hypothetical protein